MKRYFVFLLLISFSRLSLASFDQNHSQWSALLSEFTQKQGKQVLVNYKGLKTNHARLKAYLSQLESVSKEEFKSFSLQEKLAFWINVYNAYTIDIILKHYPVKSIKKIKSGWFSSGPWKIEFIPLFGEKLSLDEVEHEIIRPQFKEPRIHFAVNCASIGCPSLFQEAFVGDRIDEQLDLAAENFLKNTEKNFVKGRTLYLSKIFDWYGDDFELMYGSYIGYVIKTLNLKRQKYNVEFNSYDWSLNEI